MERRPGFCAVRFLQQDALMEIVKFPNPILLEAMPLVTAFDEELHVLLDSMWETMKAKNGLGLAANQVGLRLRVFVMEGPHGRMDLVNPSIAFKSVMPANLREGCLSAPGDFVVVPERAEWVQLSFQDVRGAPHMAVLKGLYAVCAQHELEHLDGKTFMANKSLPKATRKMLAKKWSL
jgi:peptide deformylase